MSHSSKQTTYERPAPFDDYEIHGIKQYDEAGNVWCEQVSENEAEFWSLFGHIPGGGLDCIGDFKTREYAEEIYARITGRPYRDEDQENSRDGGSQ